MNDYSVIGKMRAALFELLKAYKETTGGACLIGPFSDDEEAIIKKAEDALRTLPAVIVNNGVATYHDGPFYILGKDCGVYMDLRPGRDEALEEAACICDETYVEPGDMQVESCHEAAAAIRALKSKR